MMFFERPPVHLYLVRHGQSAANADKNVYRTLADHAIPLTTLGESQAAEAGAFLAKELAGQKAILLSSPYARARETAQRITSQLGPSLVERVELVEMVEQQLGLFDGVPEEERKERFPDEYARFQMLHYEKGRFWARPPQGDSPFDLYGRALRVANQIKYAYRTLGIDRFVMVGHGNWFACFQMAWCNLPYEWYAEHLTPWNAEIVKIEGQDIAGTIFKPADRTAEPPHAPLTPASEAAANNTQKASS